MPFGCMFVNIVVHNLFIVDRVGVQNRLRHSVLGTRKRKNNDIYYLVMVLGLQCNLNECQLSNSNLRIKAYNSFSQTLINICTVSEYESDHKIGMITNVIHKEAKLRLTQIICVLLIIGEHTGHTLRDHVDREKTQILSLPSASRLL